ncbi:MAG: UDP-N-acetylmuramoyl-L-alanyl-D-glutamate--2,6-diaminopimelate ligase [Clostridia bacterium]
MKNQQTKYFLSLSQIINILKEENLFINANNANEDFQISSISYSSQNINEATLFICKGFNFKEEYLKEAILKGAKCYLAQQNFLLKENIKIPAIIVNDVRKAMSIISAKFYNYPSNAFNLTGITGTKGKTTTTFLLKNIFDNYTGKKTGVLSTVEMYTGNNEVEAHLTTPESLELQQAFEEVKTNDLKFLTMEVSSQGYKLNRVYGVKFDVGVFMNIDEDHIGPYEHDDFEDYFNCKLQLMKNCKTAIVCRKTKRFDEVYETAKSNAQKVIIIGNENDDFYVKDIIKKDCGFNFNVVSNNGTIENYSISQEGRFNIENALCAIVIAKVYGIEYDIIKKGIENVNVKGRMNVFSKNGVKVIVDYAHNNLSFGELFKSLKIDYPDSKIIVVCGCPGGKAYIRRRDIGTLCGKYADKTYLTAEDPQFEDVKTICEEMAKYIKPYNKEYLIVEDRTIAVERAIKNAEKTDIVIIAGKGEEVYQKVKGKYDYYESDLTIAKRMIDEK